MKEYIDRDLLIKGLECEQEDYEPFNRDMPFSRVMALVNDMQGITEAEIRAKAIDEFYDKAVNFEDYIEIVETKNGVQLYSGVDITKMIVKIAEQMKEVE